MNLTVSNKGWVVIPAECRKKNRRQPGTKVRMVDYGGVLAVVPVLHDAVAQGYGLLKGTGSLTKALLLEHRKEHRRGK
jgi:bifunctional DNA-binding transcriptional regulator/antitoxin component of YhaV-PrlF toxin-antitoxin module